MTNYPVNVQQESDRELKVIWNDGVEQILDTVHLRRECPCASCIDEFTGVRKLDPNSISESIRPTNVRSIGQYAVNITFSDGHKTGFYSFKKLRAYLSKEH